MVKNLVAICIADTRENSWVRERTLEGVVAERYGRGKFCQIRFEYFQPACMVCSQPGLTPNNIERCPLLGSGFGQHQTTRIEFQDSQIQFSTNFYLLIVPLKTAGDHEV